MTSTLQSRTLRGVVVTFLTYAGQVVLSLAVLAVTARLLTPADFGLAATAMVVLAGVQLASQLGLAAALVQLQAAGPGHARTAMTAAVAASLVLAAGVALLAGRAGDFFAQSGLRPVLLVVAAALPVVTVGSILEALAQRELRFSYLAVTNLVAYLVGYGISGIALALLGAGAWALVAAQLVLQLVRAAWLARGHLEVLRPRMDRGELRELLGFGVGYSWSQIANFAAAQGDTVVLARLAGGAALGYYTRAYQLMMVPAHGLGTVADRVLFPALASIQTDRARLARGYLLATGLVALLSAPVAAAAIVAAPHLVLLLMGDQWGPAVRPFQVLVAVLALRTGSKIADSLARALGLVGRLAINQTAYAALAIGGAWLGYRAAGVTGASIGVAAAISANYGLSVAMCTSAVGVRVREVVAIQLRSATTFVLLLAGGVVIERTLDRAGLAGAPAAAAAAVAVIGLFVGVLLLLPSRLGQEGGWLRATARAATARARR